VDIHTRQLGLRAGAKVTGDPVIVSTCVQDSPLAWARGLPSGCFLPIGPTEAGLRVERSTSWNTLGAT